MLKEGKNRVERFKIWVKNATENVRNKWIILRAFRS